MCSRWSIDGPAPSSRWTTSRLSWRVFDEAAAASTTRNCLSGRDRLIIPASRQRFLDYFFIPVFQALLHTAHELMRHGAIHDSVIVTQGEIDHGTDGDGIIDDDRTLLDGPDT